MKFPILDYSVSDVELASFDKLTFQLAEEGYGIIDNFLSAEEILDIVNLIDFLREEGEFKKAGIGTDQNFVIDKTVRGDFIRWIDPANAYQPTQKYLSKIHALMNYINRTCFLGLKDYECHFALYPKETFYKRHLDQFKTNDHRILSFVFYLNIDWKEEDGGKLRMYFPPKNSTEKETFLDVNPIAGRLVCFKSSTMEHEVLQSFKNRYSITGWMLDQYHTLTFL